MPRPSLLLKKPPPPEPCQPSNPLHPLKMRVAVLVSLLLCIALAHVAKADSSGSASANDYNNWLLSSVYKRPRFSDPSDPRNLFSAVYGWERQSLIRALSSLCNQSPSIAGTESGWWPSLWRATATFMGPWSRRDEGCGTPWIPETSSEPSMALESESKSTTCGPTPPFSLFPPPLLNQEQQHLHNMSVYATKQQQKWMNKHHHQPTTTTKVWLFPTFLLCFIVLFVFSSTSRLLHLNLDGFTIS